MFRQQALLLIDTQVHMFAPGAAVHKGPELLATLQALLAQARAAAVPVIYLQHNGAGGAPAEPETPGWRIHPLLEPHVGDCVIHKHTPSAFYNTRLRPFLQSQSITELILCGVQTELAIDTTCRAAWSIGYMVTLIADGHSTAASRTLTAEQIIAHHNSVLANFGKVVPAAELVFGASEEPVL